MVAKKNLHILGACEEPPDICRKQGHLKDEKVFTSIGDLVRGDRIGDFGTCTIREPPCRIKCLLLFSWHFVFYAKLVIFLNGDMNYCISPDILLLNVKI